VRLSGPQALSIVGGLVRARGPLDQFPSHALRRVALLDPRSRTPLDDALCVVMRAPRSYTGDDVVELSCHGSPALLRMIVKLARERGARLAEPGEFTRRAFLNGRIDLTRAEAVALMIGARTERAVTLAARALAGELGTRVERLRSELLDVIAGLEVALDFPDEQVGLASGQAWSDVTRLAAGVDEMLALTDRARAIHQGVTVVLAGAPNAGKSTLLNALLGADRAIVSPVPGTTRDIVEGTIALGGIPVVLRDTAGIGPTTDAIEAEGVRRTLKAIDDSDLVLLIIDGSAAPDARVLEVARQRSCLVVRTKSDLSADDGARAIPDALEVSALTGTGIATLLGHLATEITQRVNQDDDAGLFVTTLRQREVLESLREALGRAASAIHEAPIEAVLVDLNDALGAVAELLGTGIGEAVLDRIFATFCVGK